MSGHVLGAALRGNPSLTSAIKAPCQCLGSWMFQGHVYRGCPEGLSWCAVPGSCSQADSTTWPAPPHKFASCGRGIPTYLLPDKHAASEQSCSCLSSWVLYGTTYSGCLPTGWCAVSSSCNHPAGTLQNSVPTNQKWTHCHYMAQTPLPPSPPPPPPLAPGVQPCGFYQRMDDAEMIVRTRNIQIWTCQDEVTTEAVRIARRIMEGMLVTAPESVLQLMDNVTLGIFGRDQFLTDLPPFYYLRGKSTDDGRPYSSLEGVGAPGPEFPTSAIGESDLLWLAGDPYKQLDRWEVILIHEFAHTVQNVGMENLTASQAAYNASLQRWQGELDKMPEYGWVNYEEYFAVMSESWFNSTIRQSVNLNMTTREDVQGSEVEISDVFENQAYGLSPWTYLGDPAVPHSVRPRLAADAHRWNQQLQGRHRHHISMQELRAALASIPAEEVWIRPA